MENYLLLSGGLDSTTLVEWVWERAGVRPTAITFRYGQKHSRELDAARAVADRYGLTLRLIELPRISGSALTDGYQYIPEGRDLDRVEGTAPTYVPARNLVFLAHAASFADTEGPGTIWLGVHHDDHTGYPDCRPEFVASVAQAVRLGTKHAIEVEAPFVLWTKTAILRWGLRHGVPYELTHSCYKGEYPACGVCDTCQARRRAFREAGAEDPVPCRVPTGP